MIRDDIRGITRCPQEIIDYLAVIGGRNPYQEPMWRLVLASSIIWKIAGGNIWDESLGVTERGGFNIETGHRYDNHPLRDESTFLVEQQRYPEIEGWVLQRWFPAEKYSRAEWFAPENCIPFTNIPKLGPYPQFGDYEIMQGPIPRVPAMEELRVYIKSYYYGMASRSQSMQQRIVEATTAAQYKKEQDEQRTRTRAYEEIRDKCSYLTSSSLEAGRIRTERAEKIGIRSHLGN
jgi:hypothetical protein